MTHPHARLQIREPGGSLSRRRFRLTAVSLAAGVVLSTLTIWTGAPLSALATSSPGASAGSEPVTIDVIAKASSFRALPSDGLIATQNLFDKNTGEPVGSSVFYCLEVEPATPGSQTLAECPGTATFSGRGTLSILGSFLVPPTTGQSWTVAVVGGTDSFRNVRGELKVIQISPGEEEGIWTLLG